MDFISYAQKKGAEYIELKTLRIEQTSIETQNEDVKNLSTIYSELRAVKLICKKKEALASSNMETFQELIDKAIKISKLSEEEIEFQPQKRINLKLSSKFKIDPRDIDLEQKKKDILNLNALRKDFKKIVNVKLNYSDIKITKTFANSEGTETELNDTMVIYAPWIYAKEGQVLESYFKILRGHDGYEIMKKAEEHTKETMSMAQKLLKAKYAKGGKFPVIVDQNLGGVFIHEAVGHATEADIVLQNGSVLKGKLNQKIASDILNARDDGTRYIFGWTPIDDEGTEGSNTQLIKDGTLINYLHSRQTASIMKTKPTGNGRSQSIGHRSIPRMTCTIIDEGDSNFDEMVSTIKNGYYLKGSKGGEVSPSKGEFMFNAMYGYKIEKGEQKEMVKAVSLNGNILKILPKISMIGNDLAYEHGFCGKDSQSVPVSHGTPHFKIEEAGVGGKE